MNKLYTPTMAEKRLTKAYLLSERDAVDWAVRQLASKGEITMTQMILIMRVWSAVMKRGGKRLTSRQLNKVISDYWEEG